MDKNAMRQEVQQRLLAKGILDPDSVHAEIAKLAQACPEATVAEKGLTEDIEKAYWTLMIQEGKSEETPVTQTTQATSMPAAPVSAEEQRKIIEGLTKDKNTRNLMSSDTVIEALVVDKPAPSELIAPGTKGTINKKSWEAIVKKYEGKVLPDDADEEIKSTTNFNTLKAAAEAGTPVEVMIGAMSKRPIAVIAQVPDNTGSNKKSIVMSNDKFENFVVLQTSGYVLATDTTAGAKLRYIKPSKDKRNPNVIKPAKTVLAYTNRNNAHVEVSRSVTDEVKADAACKSALCFKVDTGRKKQDGTTPIYQTVRVTVNAPVKLTERKPKFVEALGNVGKGSGNGDLLQAPDSKAMAAINQAQVAKIAELRNKVAAGDFETISVYGDALKAFGGDVAPAANTGVAL